MALKSLAREWLGRFYCFFYSYYLKKALVVFVYHDVSDHPSEFSALYNLSIAPRIFDYQIAFIKNHFNIIGPDELLKAQIPASAALITFDDGFRSYFDNAIPILEKHEVPSLIFLNSEPLLGGIFWPALIAYLLKEKNGFSQFIKENSLEFHSLDSVFLSCSRGMVEAYLEMSGKKPKNFKKEVDIFTGGWAREEDLELAMGRRGVFLGNHLFNHYVPALLSDEELLDLYFKNHNALKKYMNYREVFSFPFGRQGTYFLQEQVNLLLQNGAKKIFNSQGQVNMNVSSSYLDRISLASDNSFSKMWFRICRRLPGRNYGLFKSG